MRASKQLALPHHFFSFLSLAVCTFPTSLHRAVYLGWMINPEASFKAPTEYKLPRLRFVHTG